MLYCNTYISGTHLCIQRAAVAAAALCLCILLLHAAAIRYRVPDGIVCCGFIESNSSFLFHGSSVATD